MTLTVLRKTGQGFGRMSFGEKLVKDVFFWWAEVEIRGWGEETVSPSPQSKQKLVEVRGGNRPVRAEESGMGLGWGRFKVLEGNSRRTVPVFPQRHSLFSNMTLTSTFLGMWWHWIASHWTCHKCLCLRVGKRGSHGWGSMQAAPGLAWPVGGSGYSQGHRLLRACWAMVIIRRLTASAELFGTWHRVVFVLLTYIT